MEKKLPPPKLPTPKAVVLVGKGPPLAKSDGAGAPPGAKLALHGSGPPPAKTLLPKQGSTGPGLPKPALLLSVSPPKKPLVPSTGSPPLKPPLPGSPPKSLLPAKAPLAPPKPPLTKPPSSPGKAVDGLPPVEGPLSPASPKPPVPAQTKAPAASPAAAAKNSPAKGAASPPPSPAATKAPPDQAPPAAPKGPATKPPSAGPPKPPAKPGGPPLPGDQTAAESSGPKTAVSSPAKPPGEPAPVAKLPTGATLKPSPAAPSSAGAASSVDELGRQRGSVGDLAPKSELAQDLFGNNIPVFDRAGNFVAYATGPPPPLSRLDPSRRSRRLADARPQDRDHMKGPSERGGAFDPGVLGGVNLPGGIPGFFLSVPPWPAPTPVPMDQASGWGGYYSQPQSYVSPYAAYPPQPGPQAPYPTTYGTTALHGEAQHITPQHWPLQTSKWPGYPAQPETVMAVKDPGGVDPSGAPPTEPASQKKERSRRSMFPQFDAARARGYVLVRGDDEIGKSKWSTIERHLNNIRGGYGESSRPPEEGDEPPRRASARVRRRSSSTRDEIYSGFRPYYVRDTKPYVDEVIPRSGEPQEVSGGNPKLPRKCNLLSKPKERTWDRWGTTGLTAPRKRAYQSLSELASCFSNLESQDQNDVLSLLLLCRKLEQQVEKQHVVIDMLEHDLSEAQKVLKFPPEWRTLEGVDFAGMVPSDTPFQATAATPLYVKSTNYLPSSVPEEPNANFGVGVQLTRQAAARPTPAKVTAAAPLPGATTKAASPAAEGPKKPPAGLKPKAPTLGVKKLAFKKM